MTNVFRTTFTVTAQRTGLKKYPIGLVFIVLLVAAVLIRKRAPKGSATLKRIEEYIYSHISEEISVQKIRQALFISEHRFYDILKENKIESFPQFVNKCRISRAKELLQNPEKTISEIGFGVGFNDAAYFSKVFREMEGVTPKEFRDRNL